MPYEQPVDIGHISLREPTEFAIAIPPTVNASRPVTHRSTTYETMLARSAYGLISLKESRRRGLVSEAAWLVDGDGVTRCYHDATQLYWDPAGPAPQGPKPLWRGGVPVIE